MISNLKKTNTQKCNFVLILITITAAVTTTLSDRSDGDITQYYIIIQLLIKWGQVDTTVYP
jgi:hypothetical protein